MDNEINIDLEKLVTVINDLDSVSVDLPDEQNQVLNQLRDNLIEIKEYISNQELSEEELQERNEQIELYKQLTQDISDIKDYIIPQELTEEELNQIAIQEENETKRVEKLENDISQLNTNLIHLTEVIEEDVNTYNELDELQVKSYGSNIILLYVIIFALFANGVFKIFSFFGNKI